MSQKLWQRAVQLGQEAGNAAVHVDHLGQRDLSELRVVSLVTDAVPEVELLANTVVGDSCLAELARHLSNAPWPTAYG
jgi:hypothetical protein